MRELLLNVSKTKGFMLQLKEQLGGTLEEHWGEYILSFDSEIGLGTIRAISFDWGISLLDYDVHFNKDVQLIVSGETNLIRFVFVSEGDLDYSSNCNFEKSPIEQYQNVIITHPENTKNLFCFSEGKLKANFIQIDPEAYSKKQNNNLANLTNGLLSVFHSEENEKPYLHFGSFNLKIADQIEKLNKIDDAGIVRTLAIEGQIMLILALQIHEYNSAMSNMQLPDSLSYHEIRRVQELSNYIKVNISEPLSIEVLSKEASLSAKKLQAGFRLLHAKSVNEYVRQVKLEIARDEIKNSRYSISEIVYKIGFKSRSYFSKIFFEQYGILPTDYRRKVRS